MIFDCEWSFPCQIPRREAHLSLDWQSLRVGIMNISRNSAKSDFSACSSGLDTILTMSFQTIKWESEQVRCVVVFPIGRFKPGPSYLEYHWRWLCKYSQHVSTYIWGSGLLFIQQIQDNIHKLVEIWPFVIEPGNFIMHLLYVSIMHIALATKSCLTTSLRCFV